ncbi:MAG: sugar phosphate nucleotidyltransferase [Rhodospirillaceae bacterium]
MADAAREDLTETRMPGTNRLTRLDAYLCPPDLSVRDALARLNATEHLFQLVVDPERRLLGTLTDGDVRRALLRGVSLDAPVKESIHRDMLVGRAGVVVEVLLRGAQSPGIDRALVMAGGFGKRLGERTRKTPKPLLPVGGRPILDHVLTNLEDCGVRVSHVSVHYHGDQIRDYIAQRRNRMIVDIVEEDRPLGTAGALGQIADTGRSPILVINGDVITNVDFAALHEFHVRHALDATVGVARYDIDVPFGVVRYGPDGLLAGIDEKPRISNFIAAGVYYLSPEFAALVPGDRAMDMPELLNQGREIGLRIGLFPIHEYWTDVGRPADLEAAEASYDSAK